MVYVYALVEEIKTMKLRNMSVVSELERDIYAVRFIGTLKEYSEKGNKIELVISDNNNELLAVMYKRISVGFDLIGREIKQGDKVIIFAHLEPLSKTCSIDIIRKVGARDEVRFLVGLFKTYFQMALTENKELVMREDK